MDYSEILERFIGGFLIPLVIGTIIFIGFLIKVFINNIHPIKQRIIKLFKAIIDRSRKDGGISNVLNSLMLALIFIFIKGFSVYLFNRRIKIGRTRRFQSILDDKPRTIKTPSRKLDLSQHFDLNDNYNFFFDDYFYWIIPLVIFYIGFQIKKASTINK